MPENEAAYSVVIVRGTIEVTQHSGLTHAAAMELAEELQREGHVVRVMHVGCEVDRYPLR